MCSTVKFGECMARNFDYEQSFNEEIRVIKADEFHNEYKIIGVATGLVDEYPLLYDGMNEHGLCCSALAFEGYAKYNGCDMNYFVNVPAYDFVFFILGHYRTVKSIIKEFHYFNITNEQYKDLPNSSLHWFVCDSEDSIIIEQTSEGLKVYDGDVMTNTPPYNHMSNNYRILRKNIGGLKKYNTRGSETLGLEGDYTSIGRFVRLSYLKERLEESGNPFSNVVSAYHLLKGVEQVYGAAPVDDKFEYTIYSVIYNIKRKQVSLKFYDSLDTIVVEF